MNTETYTYSDDLISDLHKDAHGYRPREHFWSFWSDATDAEKQAEWDELLIAMDNRNQQYIIDQNNAITAFELLVTNTINNGAMGRQQAISWLMDANGTTGDYEYFCFQHGLPYSYFK
jgi:hypothetical protein